jgi:hypothetical protein
MHPAFLSATKVIAVIVGLVSLLAGRRLFWLFVGAAGFLAGFVFAGDLISRASPLLVLIVALLGGVAGALLATFLQKVSVFVAGVAAGGMFAVAVLRVLDVEAGPGLTGVVFLLGAVPGGILAAALFDWALIILSSLVGATLVARSLPLGLPWVLVVLVALIAVGVAVQAVMYRREEEAPPEPSKDSED